MVYNVEREILIRVQHRDDMSRVERHLPDFSFFNPELNRDRFPFDEPSSRPILRNQTLRMEMIVVKFLLDRWFHQDVAHFAPDGVSCDFSDDIRVNRTGLRATARKFAASCSLSHDSQMTMCFFSLQKSATSSRNDFGRQDQTDL